MKKKIRDLTLKEIIKICENRDKCKGCPVYDVCEIHYASSNNVDFDKEIEVEEDG